MSQTFEAKLKSILPHADIAASTFRSHSSKSKYTSSLVHTLNQDSIVDTTTLERSRGRSLDARLQQAASAAFGFDFSHVRVHDDAEAGASASALRAKAYTVGDHVVFARGQYQPGNEEGRRLISHELAHVAQQRDASRFANPKIAPDDGALESNATAMLANGSEPIRVPQIMIQRDRADQPTPAPSLPMVPQLTLPPLFPERQRPSIVPNLVYGAHLLPEDRARINAFLAAGNLNGDLGGIPSFQGRITNLDAVIEQARDLVLPLIPRDEVANVVIGYWILQLSRRPSLPPPPPISFPLPEVPAAPASDQPQSALGVQWTWHMNRPGPAERTVQVSLQQGTSAWQFGVNLDTGDVQAMGGVQLQKDSPQVRFLGGLLKATVFLQMLAGITTARGSASGSFTVQISAGVQVTAVFGPVTIAVQLAPVVTLQQGQGTAVDFTATPQAGQTTIPGGLSGVGGTVPLITVRF